MTDQVKHLLGGYATGTLTPQEHALLMNAALEDQDLFDALADDEALRRYLADAGFRRELLKATAPKRARLPWIAAISAAAACLVAGLFWTARRESPVREIAMSRLPAPEPQLAPALPGQPAPAKPEVRQPKKKAKPPADTVPKQNTVQTLPPAGESALQLNAQKAAPIVPGTSSFAPRSVMARSAAPVAAVPRPSISARITDVNASILTMDHGSDAGVRVGDQFEVLHDNSPIGFLTVTTAEPLLSVGRFSGIKTPEIGDTVITPKK
jgi:hypothetical protein